MPTYLAILVLTAAIAFAIIYRWFCVSTRKSQIALETLISDPEQVAEFWRSGEDGDGYNRLNVRTKGGKVVVVGHFEADEAEKRLRAACSGKESHQLKSS